MKRSKNHRLDTHEVWFFEQKTKNEFCQLNHTLYPSPSMIINADTKCPFIRFLSDSRDSAEELSSHITELEFRNSVPAGVHPHFLNAIYVCRKD